MRCGVLEGGCVERSKSGIFKNATHADTLRADPAHELVVPAVFDWRNANLAKHGVALFLIPSRAAILAKPALRREATPFG